MPTFDFTITGTIFDAPDEQQARNMIRIRLLRGAEPMPTGRVVFDPPESYLQLERVDDI